jgi:hypothetical protein
MVASVEADAVVKVRDDGTSLLISGYSLLRDAKLMQLMALPVSSRAVDSFNLGVVIRTRLLLYIVVETIVSDVSVAKDRGSMEPGT